ncbi:MAG: hypothetical protein ABW352_09215 [Polyangiales bacterium]
MRLPILTLWLALCAAHASAQTSPYAHAIEQAVAAYNASDFATARGHFAQAHALRPNARTWRGLGTCDFELARWPEAVEELTEALQDARSPLNTELRVRTEAQLETAKLKLPPPVVEPVTPAPLPEVPEVVLEPEPAPAPIAPPRERHLLRGFAVASLVVSVAGFALATGYGMRSMHEGDTRDRHCDPNGDCRDARGVDAGNEARRTGNLATAGWVLGGVGLASSIALFWTDRAKRRSDQASASLRLGPSSIAIVGAL